MGSVMDRAVHLPRTICLALRGEIFMCVRATAVGGLA